MIIIREYYEFKWWHALSIALDELKAPDGIPNESTINSNHLYGGKMVTLTTPNRRNTEAPVIDPESGVMSPAVVADMLITEEMTGAFAPVKEDNLLVKMLRGVAAFYDSLSGPAMTKRDRVLRDIAETNPGLELDRIHI